MDNNQEKQKKGQWMHAVHHDLTTSGNKKWLLLVPIAIMVLLIISMSFTTNIVEGVLLREKIVEIQDLVNTVASAVDATTAQGPEEFMPHTLVAAVEHVDSLTLVYAGVFKRDGEGLIQITKHDQLTNFDPRNYQTFWDEIDNEDYKPGQFTMRISTMNYEETESMEDRDMTFVYRWTPASFEIEDRYLIIAGVSKQSVQTPIPALIHIDTWFAIFSTLIINTGMMYVIIRQSIRVNKIKKTFIAHHMKGGDK